MPFRFHHQALVELKILDVIKRKDKDNLHNVIHMKEYFYFRNHLCISFELLGLVYNKNKANENKVPNVFCRAFFAVHYHEPYTFLFFFLQGQLI